MWRSCADCGKITLEVCVFLIDKCELLNEKILV